MICAIKEQASVALKRLCQGILDSTIASSEKLNLTEIHQNGLILLHRILFILFAENHQILPVSNPEYIEKYSLQKLRVDLQENVKPITTVTTSYWSRIKTLFGIINGTQEELNRRFVIPCFHGGLFSSERHEFLETLEINDVPLMEAFKIISQDKKGQLYDYFSLTINQLGSIYEDLLEYRVRKNSGSFYTPLKIVNYMTKTSLKLIFDNLRQESTIENRLDVEKYIELILNLKILDPALGSGHFLLGIIDALCNESSTESDKPERYRLLLKIIQEIIYGVDTNVMAVELAEAALWLELATQKEFFGTFKHQLKRGDALIGVPFKSLSETGFTTFRWDVEYPEVFQSSNPGFDLIIGNPPYINAISMRDQMSGVRDYLKSNYKFLVEKWDIYVAFIEKGLQLLKKGGILCFIIPAAFLSEKYAKPLQEYILKTHRIIQIDYFPDISLFEGVGVHNIILTIQKTPPVLPVVKVFHRDLNDPVEIKEINDFDKIFTDFFEDPIKLDVTNFYTLGDIAYISTGIVFNAKEPEFKGEFKKKDLISRVATKLHSRKLLEGENIFPYEIRGHQYVEWGSERVPEKIRRPTFTELHQANKLVTNKLGELKVAFDEEGLVCDQTVRIVIKWEQLHGVLNPSISKSLKNAGRNRHELEIISHGYDYYFLLALLNSKVCRYLFHKLRTHPSIDVNPNVIRRILVPKVTLAEQTPVIDIINLIMTHHQGGMKIRSDLVKDEIQARLQAIDREIYALYRLTPEQIQVIENSNRL